MNKTEVENVSIQSEDQSECIFVENLDGNFEVEVEDLFHKNTESFQCLTQVEISRSSLFRDPFYHFPELQDPNLDEALWGADKLPSYDDIGVQRYKDLCKKEGIMPFRRVINSLAKNTLDLKYYSLTEKEMHTICETLQFNNTVRHLLLQENWLKPESVTHLAPLMENNRMLITLNLKHCHIGKFGAPELGRALQMTKTLEELDLSYNELGDESMEHIALGLMMNNSIKKLNLSHNDLGDQALIALRLVFEDNYMIQELDLSWNYFYSPIGMKELMEALMENLGIRSLNLSWNGIGDKDTFRYILAYLKNENARIQHLNLSNNRITGIAVKMIRTALKFNENLVTLNLAFNPLTADEVEFICGTFLENRENPSSLNYINFGNTWVKKSFIAVNRIIKKKGCAVSFGGIYSNYKIRGPNVKAVLLNRAKYVAMKPKKKKFKKDIGPIIVQFKDEPMLNEEFIKMIKKQKIKLDADLLDMITTTFKVGNKSVDIQNIKDEYLKLYPDTQPPPPKKKGKKGKKGKKKKK